MTDVNTYFLIFERNLGRLPKILCKFLLGSMNTYNIFHTKLQFCSATQSFPVTDAKRD